MEAKYRALTILNEQMESTKILLEELEIQVPMPQRIKCDNLRATFVAQNLVCHTKLKHITIDFHLFGKEQKIGTLIVEHVIGDE